MLEIHDYLFAKKKITYEVELGLYDSVLEKINSISELRDIRMDDLKIGMIDTLDRNFCWSKMRKNGEKNC